jgi:DNA-binding transcriptional LysR family regulator
MNISFRQLRSFVVVAQHQSFTKAAQALYTTQSAVSLMVKELEEEIGFRLFDRTTRQVLLSSSGQDFYRMANKLLEDFQTVMRDATDIATLRRGVVRVGAAEAVAVALIIPAIAAFRRERPGIDIQLVVTLVPSMFNALRNGDVDYIIGPETMQGSEVDGGILSEQLAKSPLKVWCAADHSLARLDKVPWLELLKYDLVIPAVDFTTRIMPAIMEHLGTQGRSADLFQYKASRRMVSNITAALSMSQAGLGATFAAEYIRPLAFAFRLTGRMLVEPELDRVLMSYSRRGRELSPAAATFSDFFRKFLFTAKLR